MTAATKQASRSRDDGVELFLVEPEDLLAVFHGHQAGFAGGFPLWIADNACDISTMGAKQLTHLLAGIIPANYSKGGDSDAQGTQIFHNVARAT